jgi:ABC-type lipoprotein export system ATPase subunit
MKAQDFINKLNTQNLSQILYEYPITADFLANYRIESISKELPLSEAFNKVSPEILEEFGLDSYELLQNLSLFLENFTETEASLHKVSSITILGGVNKLKEPENINLTMCPGEVISIVGPTGSGKSRLLNDIECLAQGDTPTGREILINGEHIEEEQRFQLDGKLVAELSQNMNFVMDLTVYQFLEMHAKSRLTPNANEVIEKCFICANQLAGEQFSRDTKVTQLSGGQSRALMISDTAHMSNSPIVLIDEIENAGIDRRKAITLLAKEEKIVFVSTHDPLLALSSDKRIVIKNGGIHKIIQTSEEEKESLTSIEHFDNILLNLRNNLRSGETITKELLKL